MKYSCHACPDVCQRAKRRRYAVLGEHPSKRCLPASERACLLLNDDAAAATRWRYALKPQASEGSQGAPVVSSLSLCGEVPFMKRYIARVSVVCPGSMTCDGTPSMVTYVPTALRV